MTVRLFRQSLSLEDRLHPLGSFPPELRHDMAVGIHRQCNLRMTKNLHYDSWRDALHQEQRRARVAQVMESDASQASIVERLVEVFNHTSCL